MHGVVDKLILRFKDIWGKRRSLTTPAMRDGVAPHVGWMATESIGMPYHPSQEDYQRLRRKIASDYVETFPYSSPDEEPWLQAGLYIWSTLLRGELEKNIGFAKEKAQEVFQAGDIPICPHLMFPAFADPDDPAQDQAARGDGPAAGGALPAVSMCTVLCVHRDAGGDPQGGGNLTSRSRPTSQGLKRKGPVPGAARSDRR